MTELQKKQILKLRKKGLGYKAIAGLLDLSRDSVRSFCKKRGITGFGNIAGLNIGEQIKQGNMCLNCYEVIKQPIGRGRPKKFCSDKCRMEWWKNHPEKIKQGKDALYTKQCAYCGKEFTAYGNKNRKYCSHSCYIQDRFWRKGK